MKILTTLGESPPCKRDPKRVDGHHIPGWMSEVELYWLSQQAKRHDSIVEVGSWRGRSSYALAKNCPGRVICVDHFNGGDCDKVSVQAGKDVKRDFLRHMKSFMGKKAFLVEKTSLEAAKMCNERVDMVFIDGSHDYESVRNDILAWLPKTKVLLCGHDFFYDDVKKAVQSIFGKDAKTGYGGIWYVEVARGVGKID